MQDKEIRNLIFDQPLEDRGVGGKTDQINSQKAASLTRHPVVLLQHVGARLLPAELMRLIPELTVPGQIVESQQAT